MEIIHERIYLGGQYVNFTVGQKLVRVVLKPNDSINKIIGDEFKDGDFTTNPSDIISANEFNEKSEKIMVAALAARNEGLKRRDETNHEEL